MIGDVNFNACTFPGPGTLRRSACIVLLIFYLSYYGFPMNSRNWHILCRNIYGLNASDKWDAVRIKIKESACFIICLQETKRELVDISCRFAPKHFDRFDFVPFVGASGGSLWHG